MSFRTFGSLVSRYWVVPPIVWGVLLVVLSAVAPPTRDVITDGDFKFLPAASPSLQGERVFAAHFEGAVRGSNIVVIARRAGRGSKLTAEDRQFVDQVLAPRIRAIADQTGWSRPEEGDGPLVAEVSTSGTDKAIGPLLNSRDGAATLVRISLTTELTERKNDPLIAGIRQLIEPVAGDLKREGLIPAGLDLHLTGPPVIGRDMRMAAAASARATEKATVLLVIALLILIYRAPLLALIPLVTVAIAVKIALSVLAILAKAGYVTLFHGCEIYVTVVTYGAGIDYCMFLMARYKEELDNGAPLGQSIAGSIGGIGGALTASAATVIVGIGMMVFAEFGRFRQAGIAMSFSLLVVVIASLTLAPALLRLFGKYAFWPGVIRERPAEQGSDTPSDGRAGQLGSRGLQRIWEDLAAAIVRRPGMWWLGSALAMLPLVIVGILFFDRTTYGLLTELPPDSPSVLGIRAVQDHFPAGETGPVTILIAARDVSFSEPSGSVVVANLTDALWNRRKELGIADIRSQANPYGMLRSREGESIFARRLQRHAATRHYVSNQGPGADRITRFDVIFHDDPFSRDSLDELDHLKAAVNEVLPPEVADARIYYIGSTASIHDLKAVTGRDQIRIDLMVLAGVFAVLVALLRQIMVAAYLIFTVFFSFLATLGVTIAAFWMANPEEFVGLDWKVPIFLFTILVAVGEDYNIYLVARVDEEQRRVGGVAGVRVALARTGGIISSCGIIMAGTFCSLMFGSLTGMIQLGFALAFGVILDTFVVRPILVPAYLVMLNDGRFGSFSRLLGAYVPEEEKRIVNP